MCSTVGKRKWSVPVECCTLWNARPPFFLLLHWRSHGSSLKSAWVAAWAPGLQSLTLHMLPDTMSLNPTSKWIIRPWHNFSPLFLSSSQNLPPSWFFTCLLFSQSGLQGDGVGEPHLSDSCEFKMARHVCLRSVSWSSVSGAPPYRFITLASTDDSFSGLSWVVLPWVWTFQTVHMNLSQIFYKNRALKHRPSGLITSLYSKCFYV